MLNEETLRAALGARPFQYYPVVGSTNDLAAAWLRSGAPTGAAVIADEQRAGRGRQGRVWHTPAGSALAVSIILRPKAAQAALCSVVGALAVVDVCAAVGIQNVGIKWPNDVQVDGRKVAGVLPEAVWINQELVGVVLGIGVNVSVRFEGELEERAASLEPLAGRSLDRSVLLSVLLSAVDTYSQLEPNEVLSRWRARLITIGQRVRVGGVVGLAVDTDQTGALLVQTDGGSVERVVAGDIALVGG
jgi:BirA family biotin operon repressor/biotin-[acetyl-CoA-carboxylase] ligase